MTSHIARLHPCGFVSQPVDACSTRSSQMSRRFTKVMTATIPRIFHILERSFPLSTALNAELSTAPESTACVSGLVIRHRKCTISWTVSHANRGSHGKRS